jgi:hypothetical protein
MSGEDLAHLGLNAQEVGMIQRKERNDVRETAILQADTQPDGSASPSHLCGLGRDDTALRRCKKERYYVSLKLDDRSFNAPTTYGNFGRGGG